MRAYRRNISAYKDKEEYVHIKLVEKLLDASNLCDVEYADLLVAAAGVIDGLIQGGCEYRRNIQMFSGSNYEFDRALDYAVTMED